MFKPSFKLITFRSLVASSLVVSSLVVSSLVFSTLMFASAPALAATGASDSSPSASSAVPDAAALLRKAEQYRGLSENFVLNGRIETLRDGVQEKIQPYQLLAGQDRKSLVIFTDGINKGQKVLLQDQQFWLQIPGSRRPLRITPLQKLMGEASSGDVASLSWQQDYQISSITAVRVDAVTGTKLHDDAVTAQSQAAWQLELTAARDGLSYARIQLLVAADDAFPLSAEFYLASGKVAKQARFVRGQRLVNQQPSDAVIAMQLSDKLQSKAVTVLHYDALTEQQLPARFFNPQALATVQAL